MDSTGSVVSEESTVNPAALSEPSVAPSYSVEADAGDRLYAGAAGLPADQEMADGATAADDDIESDETYDLADNAELGNSGGNSSQAASADEDNSDTTLSSESINTGEPLVSDVPTDTDTADSMRGIAGAEGDYLSFQDIFPALQEEVSSVTITDHSNNKVVTLNLLSEIQDFYTTMEQLEFTAGTQAPASISYTLKVAGLNSLGELFTITIGDSVMVELTAGDAVSRSIYNPLDETALLKAMAGYFQ
jgi:hypothetical protein